MTAATRSGVDVLVVGAGPAGLAAAASAAEFGASVLVVDSGIRPGGQIWRHREQRGLPDQARRLLERVRAAGAVIASGARIVDLIGPREYVIDFHGRVARQHAGSVVLATGAKERFLPFPGWTIPGGRTSFPARWAFAFITCGIIPIRAITNTTPISPASGKRNWSATAGTRRRFG